MNLAFIIELGVGIYSGIRIIRRIIYAYRRPCIKEARRALVFRKF